MSGVENKVVTSSWTYSERDVILYALSVGCTSKEIAYVYECHANFGVLPTFGVLPLYNGGLKSVDLTGLVPNYNPMLVLHGEQYLEQLRPFPSSGTVVTELRIVDVLDKGKAAVIIIGTTTKEASSGNIIAENELTTFVRGAGGFGKTEPKPRRAAAVANHERPSRPPDAFVEERTRPDLAALYRLTGDENPLHIDPEFAALGGYPRPILHGLCTFGIAGKHVLKTFGNGEPGNLKSIKGRFAKHVFPGETLRTEMWQEPGGKIIFQVRVLERDVIALSNAAVVLKEGSTSQNSKL